MHEAEHRMNMVVIQKQALAMTRYQLQTFAVMVAHDLIRQAGFDRGKNADQPLLDAVGPGDLAGDVLLAGRTRSQIADRPALRRASASDASLS